LNRRFIEADALKGIKTKVRQFEWHEAARKVLLIVSALSLFDAVMSVLLGKSRTVLLFVDLLFLEGSVILAVGTFIAAARAVWETQPSSKTSTETTVNAKQTPKKPIHFSMLMVIIGAILICLSIIVGTLLP